MVERGDLLQNRYQVVKMLGQGGFGKIFEVIDKSDRAKRKVLKVLNLSNFKDKRTKQTVLDLPWLLFINSVLFITLLVTVPLWLHAKQQHQSDRVGRAQNHLPEL
jgi:serine/threonine protein kinase